MALPDPQVKALRDRRRERWVRAMGILAAAAVGAAIALWIVEVATGQPVVVLGFTNKIFTTAVFLVLVWLVLSVERRLDRRLESIEGARYRDGYAAGYLDAAARFKGGPMGRPNLRPVK